MNENKTKNNLGLTFKQRFSQHKSIFKHKTSMRTKLQHKCNILKQNGATSAKHKRQPYKQYLKNTLRIYILFVFVFPLFIKLTKQQINKCSIAQACLYRYLLY